MADRYIPEHRRTQFKAKNTFKPEELRRRREEQQVEIRKAKREENLAKRRGITGDGSARLGASLGAEADSEDETVPSESQVSQQQIGHTFPLALESRHPGEDHHPAPACGRHDGLLVYSAGGVAPSELLFFACVDRHQLSSGHALVP